MKKTQIQFPDPLYRRLKQVAEQHDWTLAEVVRRACEAHLQRFPEPLPDEQRWSYPVVDMGGEFLVDPATVSVEAEAIDARHR